eukprot:scaffold982_cov139-Cylindrotheca_fusiformis.AAC.10
MHPAFIFQTWTLLSSGAALAFTGSSYSQKNARVKIQSNRLMVLQDPQMTEEKADWWVDYNFEHSGVAQQVRPDFEILSTTKIGDSQKPLVYLDSAATSQIPKQVIDEISFHSSKRNANVHRGAHTLSRNATTAYEGARDTIAAFVNANSRNEIVFTSGATEGLNLVASSYGRSTLKPGDEIVITEMEHHSNIVPWQIIAKETGAKLRYANIDFEKGEIDMDQFISLFNEKTKIVAFQHVSNVLGCCNPVKDLVEQIRTKSPDAVTVLDACQAVPHMKVDVQDLGVDFMVFSGHKMCGPSGIGVLWGKEDLLNSMPPYMGGGEMIDQVTMEESTFAPAPARFEAGTPPITQAVGLGAAVKYLESVGMDKVQAYEAEIGGYLHKRLSQVDRVHVLGPPVGTKRSALCAFYVDGVHPSDLGTFLDMEGVALRAGHHCCQPLHEAKGISHSARASLYIYNTKEYVGWP